ncbi:MAG: 50S ribosomal protein L29 [Holosporaceae bacterium]|jgi:ribosomal protein L29|nr:50S ribosomal protein L29 [Holosporaceae bacterium]
MSNDKKIADIAAFSDLENAKKEAMRLRFRKVFGESPAPHVVKEARRKVAECAKIVSNYHVGKENA